MLTGSQNLLLLRSVGQSLPGRTALLHLLPLSVAELQGRDPMEARSLGERPPVPGSVPPGSLFETLLAGLYPRIHDLGLDAGVWLRNYYQTYVERDVRELLATGDLEAFGRFMRLCAGRSGHLLNLSGLASDAGISHTTARRWLSVPEASFLVVLLRPRHRNFSKQAADQVAEAIPAGLRPAVLSAAHTER